MDEFGKGTLCGDGVGLLCAALRHFAAQQLPCKLIACTHISEVLDERYLKRCGVFSINFCCAIRMLCKRMLYSAT